MNLLARTDDQPPIVDCHTHFYDPTRPEGVPWPGKDDAVLYRTVLPKHFLEQAATLGVTKTVVVEASPWVEDNAWLLDLGRQESIDRGRRGQPGSGQADVCRTLKAVRGERDLSRHPHRSRRRPRWPGAGRVSSPTFAVSPSSDWSSTSTAARRCRPMSRAWPRKCRN